MKFWMYHNTNERVKTQRMGGGGMQTLVECATNKIPIIVISSYKETEQNTCPSPEADAGSAILSLGPLHSKETFWRWIRLSSMKHKGLLVLRLTHIHTNNWTSPHLHFQRGNPLKYCGIILSTPRKNHVRTHFRSRKLGFSCYMWTRVRLRQGLHAHTVSVFYQLLMLYTHTQSEGRLQYYNRCT